MEFNGARMRAIKGDQEGVGGFLEAMVAVVAISCGIVLISISLASVSSALHDESEDEDVAVERLIGLLLEEIPSSEEGMFDAQQLIGLSISERLEREFGGNGGKACIVELYPETQSVWNLSFGEVVDDRPITIRSVPVNVYHSASDIRPALLVVSLW